MEFSTAAHQYSWQSSFWPFYLQREFFAVLLPAVSIFPEAPAVTALDELYTFICTKVNHIAGISSTTDLGQNVLSRYHQHTSCPTRGNRILDHSYITVKGIYKSMPHLTTVIRTTHLGCWFQFTNRNYRVYCWQWGLYNAGPWNTNPGCRTVWIQLTGQYSRILLEI